MNRLYESVPTAQKAQEVMTTVVDAERSPSSAFRPPERSKVAGARIPR